MLSSFPVAVGAGAVLGFLSGLGIGGGSLLILWLTLILDMPQDIARSVNLMFFIPSALIACCFRLRQGTLDIKRILPALLAGSISAVLFTLVSRQLDTELLRKPFGILLLATGLREILYRPRKAR